MVFAGEKCVRIINFKELFWVKSYRIGIVHEEYTSAAAEEEEEQKKQQRAETSRRLIRCVNGLE